MVPLLFSPEEAVFPIPLTTEQFLTLPQSIFSEFGPRGDGGVCGLDGELYSQTIFGNVCFQCPGEIFGCDPCTQMFPESLNSFMILNKCPTFNI